MRPLTSDDTELRVAQNRSGVLDLYRRPPRPAGAVYPIKVFSDFDDAEVGDAWFVLGITETDDLDGKRVIAASAYVTSECDDDIVVQIVNRNTSVGLFNDPLQIDAGDLYSDTSTSPVDIDAAAAVVATWDQLEINVENSGVGGVGLGVVLWFG